MDGFLLFVAVFLHFLSWALNPFVFVDWGQPPLLMNCLPRVPCCSPLLMFLESWQRKLKAACFVSFLISCNRQHETGWCEYCNWDEICWRNRGSLMAFQLNISNPWRCCQPPLTKCLDQRWHLRCDSSKSCESQKLRKPFQFQFNFLNLTEI